MTGAKRKKEIVRIFTFPEIKTISFLLLLRERIKKGNFVSWTRLENLKKMNGSDLTFLGQRIEV